MTYLNLSAQLILLGQEGNVSREPFARIFPSKIVRDRRELIDLIRSTGFDDRWPWAAEWQKFSNFLLFFLSVHWPLMMMTCRKRPTHSPSVATWQGENELNLRSTRDF